MTHDAPPSPHGRLSRPRLVLAFLATAGVVGCATIGGDRGQPLVPTRYETRTGPFVVFTNTPVAADAPSLRSLRSLEREVAGHLGLRAPAEAPPVEIYVLRNRDDFTHFLTFYYPELPPRRAFFLAHGHRRVIYTFHNDRLDEDLRHEATHALLHLTVGDLPLWLDEGLAEYFEVPDDRHGLNAEHVARLPDDLKSGWRPDLSRLETLRSVREMTPRDYRESWAWVHYMLDGPAPARAALLAALGDLRTSPATAVALSERLTGKTSETAAGQGMLTHLDKVSSSYPPTPRASAATNSGATVLFQNAPIDPPHAGARRSFFGRLLSVFGPSSKKADVR